MFGNYVCTRAATYLLGLEAEGAWMYRCMKLV